MKENSVLLLSVSEPNFGRRTERQRHLFAGRSLHWPKIIENEKKEAWYELRETELRKSCTNRQNVLSTATHAFLALAFDDEFRCIFDAKRVATQSLPR